MMIEKVRDYLITIKAKYHNLEGIYVGVYREKKSYELEVKMLRRQYTYYKINMSFKSYVLYNVIYNYSNIKDNKIEIKSRDSKYEDKNNNETDDDINDSIDSELDKLLNKSIARTSLGMRIWINSNSTLNNYNWQL